MSNKLTKEDFDKDLIKFEKDNQVKVLISYKEFQNVKIKIPVKCLICGQEYKKEYYVLRKGVGHQKCIAKRDGRKKRVSEEEYIQNLEVFKSRQNLKVLTPYEGFQNSRSVLQIRCLGCGEESDKKYSKLKEGIGCRKCKIDGRKILKKQFEENVVKFEKEMNLKVLVGYEGYKGVHSKVPVECLKCGYKCNKIYKEMQCGHGCLKCGHEKTIEVKRLKREQFERETKEIKEKLNLECLSEFEELKGIEGKVLFKCHQCGAKYEKNYKNTRDGHGCKYCSSSGPSKAETEIYEFVSENNSEVLQGVRNVIAPLEIDVYVPSKRFGIEYHGLYWHSESKVGKKYHIEKWRKAKDANVSLMQIFSDQWRDKKEILKSMIRNKLGRIENRVGARETQMRVLSSRTDKKRMKEFLDTNHLSGYTGSTIGFGLFHDGEMVSCLSLRRPFTRKHKGSIEIARFASKINLSVSGGFGKLMKGVKAWCKENNIPKILTYADLKTGNGNVYLNYGFKFIGETLGEYWYVEGEDRINRFKCRAQDGLSEKEYIDKMGLYRIYGVGSNIFELEI